MLDEMGRVEAAEASIDAFVAKRARGAKSGREHANEEAARQREKDARYESAVRLVNAKAWAEYFGGQSAYHHDRSAHYAAKRDEALALIRELTGERG